MNKQQTCRMCGQKLNSIRRSKKWSSDACRKQAYRLRRHLKRAGLAWKRAFG